MRDLNQLHPRAKQKAEQLIQECAKQGLKIGISETFRTVAEQNELYAKGRTKPGNRVTNARGTSYSSMHQWGVAFDFYRNDGTGAYNDKDGFFRKVGNIGIGLGLEWGGNWKSIVDTPHFQLPDWGSTTSRLKTLYGTPDRFRATWGTSTATSTYTPPTARSYVMKGDRGDKVKEVQKLLKKAGYDIGSSGVDGIAGKMFDAAVRQFQTDAGLTVDGKAGTKTIEALKKKTKKTSKKKK